MLELEMRTDVRVWRLGMWAKSILITDFLPRTDDVLKYWRSRY